MIRIVLLLFAVVMLMGAGANVAQALSWGNGAWSCCTNGYQTGWHGGYYHAAWGMPVAVVVPPTAEVHTDWGWGVGNTRITPNCPQFTRNYPGPHRYQGNQYRPTPPWPSDTNQFGAYYVRGPW
jgi:hypothetical protein